MAWDLVTQLRGAHVDPDTDSVVGPWFELGTDARATFCVRLRELVRDRLLEPRVREVAVTVFGRLVARPDAALVPTLSTDLRRYGLIGLASAGDRASAALGPVRALVATDDEESILIARAEWRLGGDGPQALGRLRRAMRSADPEVVRVAMQLVRTVDPSGGGALSEVLELASHAEATHPALDDLAALVAGGDDRVEERFPVVVRLLDRGFSADVHEPMRAWLWRRGERGRSIVVDPIRSLEDGSPGDALADELVSFLGRRNPDELRAALRGLKASPLGRLGVFVVLESLRTARVLDAEWLPWVRRALELGDEVTEGSALAWIRAAADGGTVSQEDLSPCVLRGVESRNESTKVVALDLLVRIDPRSPEGWARLIASSVDSSRVIAATARHSLSVAARQDPEGVGVALRKQPVPHRAALARACAANQDGTDAPVELLLWMAHVETSDAVAQTLVSALGERALPKPAALRILGTVAARWSGTTRVRAAREFERVGGEKCVAAGFVASEINGLESEAELLGAIGWLVQVGCRDRRIIEALRVLSDGLLAERFPAIKEQAMRAYESLRK